MALYFISEKNIPNYIALSSDVVDGKIEGASLVGRSVYLTDTQEWYRIETGLVLRSQNKDTHYTLEVSSPTQGGKTNL